MKKFEYIFFDIDGTVCDSVKGIFESFRFMLGKFGIQVDSDDDLQRLIGLPLHKSLKLYYFEDETTLWEAVKVFREYYGTTGLFKSDLYPGIYDLIKDLHADGRKLFVATAKPTPFAEKVMGHHKLTNFFTQILGCTPDGQNSDKAELIEIIRKDFPGINSDNSIIIGDRKYDIMGGKGAGIKTAGVTYGYGTEEELKDQNPDFLVHSVNELSKILH